MTDFFSRLRQIDFNNLILNEGMVFCSPKIAEEWRKKNMNKAKRAKKPSNICHKNTTFSLSPLLASANTQTQNYY